MSIRLLLLFGGRSVEHEVSVRSARSILAALDPDRYEVTPVAITPEGAWFTSDNPLGVRQPEAPEGRRRALLMRPEPGAGVLDGERQLQPDVVFPLVHGVGGEDGTLQGLFELAEVPYVGCGVLASALAMDKAQAKTVFDALGLPVAEARVVTAAAWRDNRRRVIEDLATWREQPVFIKPANCGSSIGVTRAATLADRPAAIEEALSFDLTALVEVAIDGREIEVSVLGNDEPRSSVPGEIVPAREFYDYFAKYEDDRTRLLVPAPLEEGEADRLRHLAVAAFRAIGGSGLARIDFLVDRTSGAPYVSEVNTMPGFTDVSMYPRLWEATGLSYGALLDRIVELALERHAARRRLHRRRPDDRERDMR